MVVSLEQGITLNLNSENFGLNVLDRGNGDVRMSVKRNDFSDIVYQAAEKNGRLQGYVIQEDRTMKRISLSLDKNLEDCFVVSFS
jgi:hypothetical protein